MRRLLAAAAALWVGRWLAQELAAYLGRRPVKPPDQPRTSDEDALPAEPTQGA